MSIDSEVTSMTQNIQADYEGLENIGADLTGINKNILNIRTILDTIYNDLPKVTGEGTEVTLTPTLKGKLGIVEKGNSTQESTTGKQLFNKNSTNYLTGNASATILDTGIKGTITVASGYNNIVYIVKDLTNDVGKTIRAKANISKSNSNLTSQYRIGVCNSGGGNRAVKSYTDTSETTISFTVSTLAENQNYLFIELLLTGSYSASVNDYVNFTDLIVTIDNEDMSYEDFTGNLPSPNPSYPQPIKSVTR